uniref:ATP-binding cassette, sub-family C member 10 n=1 Tax=Jaculus jaculus TaxID=51337 RepID=A0A8C5LC58_JACJA
VTELLSGIRVIKFFGWEQALGARVEAHRARELGRLRVIKYLDAACVYLWAALPVVVSIAIFITYVLTGHQLTATKGMLVGIVGKVGCGKSSLLAAIAGELHRLRGQVAVLGLSKGFGLATQEPWIQFATIRDNILFGKAFDAQLYREVLEACALDDDLSMLPAGDQTEVGEKGVTLSGGQRARIALARAVYQEKALYLLDDPLAAVDADVANHLLHRCILGVLSNTTRLLCTHRMEYLDRADVVL